MRPELAVLWTRPFWLDEWHTALVANRASAAELFSDLYRGSDLGPPGTHLFVWAVGGGLTPVGGRMVSFLAVLVALVCVALTLRRRFAPASSAVGAVAVATQPIVVSYAFELRYYCLWMAFAAAFAWSLGIDGDRTTSRRRDTATAILAVLLCLTHWLAVITLVVMCAGAVASHGRAWRVGLRRVAPASAGVIALVASLPLLLAQRAAFVEKSWVPSASVGDVTRLMSMYWGGAVVLISLVVLLFALFRADVNPVLRATGVRSLRDPGIAALLATLVTPAVMLAVTIVYPALLPRYSLTTTLAWAPVLALALHASRWLVRATLVFVVAAYLWGGILNVSLNARNFATSVAVSRKAIARACAMGIPVIFHSRYLLYPAVLPSVPGAERCDVRLLGVSDATLRGMFPAGSYLPRFFRFETEVARLHQRLYGFPVVASDAEVRALPALLLVGWDDAFPEEHKSAARFARAVFPSHRITPAGEALTLVARQ